MNEKMGSTELHLDGYFRWLAEPNIYISYSPLEEVLQYFFVRLTVSLYLVKS